MYSSRTFTGRGLHMQKRDSGQDNSMANSG
jgi:hypothetical protein